jgi:hypothetical protein
MDYKIITWVGLRVCCCYLSLLPLVEEGKWISSSYLYALFKILQILLTGYFHRTVNILSRKHCSFNLEVDVSTAATYGLNML